MGQTTAVYPTARSTMITNLQQNLYHHQPPQHQQPHHYPLHQQLSAQLQPMHSSSKPIAVLQQEHKEHQHVENTSIRSTIATRMILPPQQQTPQTSSVESLINNSCNNSQGNNNIVNYSDINSYHKHNSNDQLYHHHNHRTGSILCNSTTLLASGGKAAQDVEINKPDSINISRNCNFNSITNTSC